jgi:hypothetical protein
VGAEGDIGEGGSIRVAARVGLLGEDGSRALLLLEEYGGGKNPGASGVVLLLHVDGGGDHGVEFLPELGGLGSLVGVIGGQGGGTVTKDAAEGERAACP